MQCCSQCCRWQCSTGAVLCIEPQHYWCVPAPPVHPAARLCHGCLLAEGSTPSCLYGEMRVTPAPHTVLWLVLPCGECWGHIRVWALTLLRAQQWAWAPGEEAFAFTGGTVWQGRRTTGVTPCPCIFTDSETVTLLLYLSACVFCPAKGRTQMVRDALEPCSALPGVRLMQGMSMALSGPKHGPVKLSENLGQNRQSHTEPQ